MIDTEAFPIVDPGLSDQTIQTCMDSLGWSVWALSLATAITTFPVEEVASEITAAPDYAGQVVEVYKMMAIERAIASTREKIADESPERLRKVLTQDKKLSVGDPLSLSIDYNKVRPCCGIHSDDVHCLRPVRR